jgi:hypothetical protein
VVPRGDVWRLQDSVDATGLVDRSEPVGVAVGEDVVAEGQHASPPRMALGRSTRTSPGFTTLSRCSLVGREPRPSTLIDLRSANQTPKRLAVHVELSAIDKIAFHCDEYSP